MFCSNCGKQVADGALFCPNCGAKLAVRTAQPATPEYAPPVVPQPPYSPEPQQAYQQPQQAYQQPQQAYQQPQQAYQQPQQGYQAYQQPVYQQPAYQQPAYQPQTVTAKKGSGKKGLLIAVSCLLVAAIGFGLWWFLLRNKTSNDALDRLEEAADRSVTALDEYTEELPNLNAIVRNLQDLDEGDALRLAVDALNEMTYHYGGDDVTYSGGLRLNADLDTKNSRLLVAGTYSTGEDGGEIPFSLYVDEKQIQIASTAILNEGEVLSLPLEDLPAKWNKSALGKLSGFTMPESMDLSGTMNFDIEKALLDTYGEDWTKFRDSVDMVPYEGTSHFTGDGDTYTLTWDQELLKVLTDKTDVDTDDLLDIDDPTDLANIDLNGIIAKAIVAGLGEASEAVKENQIYQVKDAIHGVYLEIDDGYEKTQVEFLLKGEKNPWEHISLSSREEYSSYTITETYDVVMTTGNGQLRIDVTMRHDDTDGPEYCYTEGPYTLIYNDADGKITFEEEGEAMEDAPDVHLVPVEGGAKLSVVMDNSWSEYYTSAITETILISGKVSSIDALSSKPTDLLELSEQELQELFQRIQEKINGVSGY